MHAQQLPAAFRNSPEDNGSTGTECTAEMLIYRQAQRTYAVLKCEEEGRREREKEGEVPACASCCCQAQAWCSCHQ